MRLKERICRKCKGTGIRVIGDEWIGRKENTCDFCQGEGTYLEGFNGYQVFELIPEKFLILDKGDIWYLYIKRSDGIYLWASWSVGVINKLQENDEAIENIDELEPINPDLELLITLFYESDQKWISGPDGNKPQTDLEEGYLEFAINNK